MRYLADTNIVTRRVLPADAQHDLVRTAIDRLLSKGETVYVTAQVLVEFRALATRPLAANGLGLTPEDASIRSQMIEAIFPLLQEVPTVYAHWRRLADTFRIVGRQVFDTRLVAVMLAHDVTNILTLDARHFQRFAAEGITVVEPHEVRIVEVSNE